jgi:alpha-ribazole phosphatase
VTAPVVVHLMRHGEPVLAGCLLGRTDSPATAAGLARARAAALDLDIGACVTSDLVRASACAEAIAAVRNIPVRVDPRWRELDFGDWDGRPAAAVDPEALARFWNDPDAAPPPGGERWSALVARVGAALAELGERTLVVTHAGAMRAALAVACSLDARQVWAFDLPYASLLSLRLWPGEPGSAQVIGLRS